MRKARFEAYQGKDKQWYWRLRAKNGKIIGDGSEGYTRKRDVLRAIDTVLMAIFDADIVER